MINRIIIYRFSGRQGFFTIPKKWCEECDIIINLVNSIIDEYQLEDETELIIRPWFIWFLVPLLKYKTLHAPMLIINDTLISAGVIPDRERVLNALHIHVYDT